ncbi:hypothetical protein [Inediibacterium massiliense]|uniref:hypothetical protein n=1 Tax=Inediibacterium massiliense TaxID=1658111 RepID=UPI0006B59E6B|nr:hypothetical protein [Inediibacterium massiliense]
MCTKNFKKIVCFLAVFTMVFAGYSFNFSGVASAQGNKSTVEATIEINPPEIYPDEEVELTIKAPKYANSSAFNLYLLNEEGDIIKQGNRPVQFAGVKFDKDGNGLLSVGAPWDPLTNKLNFGESAGYYTLQPGKYYLGIGDRSKIDDEGVIAKALLTVK